MIAEWPRNSHRLLMVALTARVYADQTFTDSFNINILSALLGLTAALPYLHPVGIPIKKKSTLAKNGIDASLYTSTITYTPVIFCLAAMPNVSITVEGRAIFITAETFNAGSFNSSEKTCIGATLGCNTPEVCRWFMIWVSSDCRGMSLESDSGNYSRRTPYFVPDPLVF
ncbi:hypothetical protein V8E55_012041 [Tylopilus felleus]